MNAFENWFTQQFGKRQNISLFDLGIKRRNLKAELEIVEKRILDYEMYETRWTAASYVWHMKDKDKELFRS